MTCIVGIAHDGDVHIGGDRAASNGESIVSIRNPKIGLRHGWIYGYAGTIGIGQLMSFIDLPPAGEVDVLNYIRLDIVDSLKKAIESFSNVPSENDTSWLIGAQGRLFELSSEDWGIVEMDCTAIGGGSQYAFGSLYTTRDLEAVPLYRIDMALKAAIEYSPTCQGPIDTLSCLGEVEENS